MKDSTQVSKGRAAGGLATLWHKSLTKYVSKKNCISNRIQATYFEFPNCPTLIINVYFPCDPRSNTADISELIQVLGEIESIIVKVGISNVMLIGDLNCDFDRHTQFTTTIENWLQDKHLIPLWSTSDTRVEQVDFTFNNPSCDNGGFSTIDHIAVNPHMTEGLISAGVLHDGSNLSYHSPIYAKFDIGAIDVKLEQNCKGSHVSWLNANEQAKANFKDCFEEKLSQISYNHKCLDVHCTSAVHKNHLEDFTITVLSEMESAAKFTLPKVVYGVPKRQRRL